MFTVCLVGLVLSILALFTTKQVSAFIAPNKESLSAIPRTILSIFWFTFGGLISLIFALLFGLGMALLR